MSKKDNPMDSEMFALYNIVLGIALVVMFYAVIYNALKSLMEVGRAPSQNDAGSFRVRSHRDLHSCQTKVEKREG